MTYNWDEHKNKINIEKHGICFEDAKLMFEHSAILSNIDNRKDYGEIRIISIGELKDTNSTDIQPEIIVITVVHTHRNNAIRIISARKANRKERGLYYEYIKRTNPKDQ